MSAIGKIDISSSHKQLSALYRDFSVDNSRQESEHLDIVFFHIWPLQGVSMKYVQKQSLLWHSISDNGKLLC